MDKYSIALAFSLQTLPMSALGFTCGPKQQNEKCKCKANLVNNVPSKADFQIDFAKVAGMELQVVDELKVQTFTNL